MADVKVERGRRFRAAREACSLTLGEAARAIGVDARTLRSWEDGRTEPRLYKFIAMLDLYHVPADALAAGASAR